jgi:hypothetical protein
VDEGQMTTNKNLKRRVRTRAATTGESYAAALRHVRPAPQGDTMPEVELVRLATAQVVVRAQQSIAAPAGTIAPDGQWAARCPGDGQPAVTIADIDNRPESIDIAVTRARPWRRQV